MKRNVIYKIFSVIFLLSVLCSCSNLVKYESNTNGTNEKGRLFLSTNVDSARTIFADEIDKEKMTYYLYGTVENGVRKRIKYWNSYSAMIGDSSVTVNTGNWKFELEAKGSSSVYYSATITKTIVVGDNSLVFNLSEDSSVLTEGTANVYVTLTFPSNTGAHYVEAGLLSVSDYSEISGFGFRMTGSIQDGAVSSEKKIVYSGYRVPSGIYLLQFNFYNYEGSTRILFDYSEIIQVKNGRIITATREITNIVNMHEITYKNIDDGVSLATNSLKTCFYEYDRIVLPTGADITKNGYTFGGWYDNEGCTGTPITEICNENKDITLWAKWNVISTSSIKIIQPEQKKSLFNGETLHLGIEIVPEDLLSTITWTSSDNDIATIDENGDVSVSSNIKNKCTVTFTVQTLDGTSEECTFNVFKYLGKLTSSNITSIIPDYTSKSTSVIIPEGVTEIDENLFKNNTYLETVILPSTLTTIGASAFYGCKELTSVEIGNNVTIIGEAAFESSGLTSVEIPDSVITIGNRAFAVCNGLTSVKIGNNVTTIGNSAFYRCYALTSVDIPDSVITIGTSAFYCCYALKSVKIPNGVTRIGGSAFESSGLTSVEIPDSVTTIGNRAFAVCNYLTSVKIGNNVTTIGAEAFAGYNHLTSVEIPDSVTTIGEQAFAYCKELKSVKLPENLIEIKNCTFSKTPITSIVIPSNVRGILMNAFANCEKLTSVKFENTNGWFMTESELSIQNIDSFKYCIYIDVSNEGTNATILKTFSEFYNYDSYKSNWYRKSN